MLIVILQKPLALFQSLWILAQILVSCFGNNFEHDPVLELVLALQYLSQTLEWLHSFYFKAHIQTKHWNTNLTHKQNK